jgi:small subunit ribosomal protein S16
MAVRIRLSRMGSKKRPFYRLVAADSESPRDGRFIEILGYYDPMKDPAEIRVDKEKIKGWLRNGAMVSGSAKAILRKEGLL